MKDLDRGAATPDDIIGMRLWPPRAGRSPRRRLRRSCTTHESWWRAPWQQALDGLHSIWPEAHTSRCDHGFHIVQLSSWLRWRRGCLLLHMDSDGRYRSDRDLGSWTDYLMDWRAPRYVDRGSHDQARACAQTVLAREMTAVGTIDR
jgi:hypothetical protein